MQRFGKLPVFAKTANRLIVSSLPTQSFNKCGRYFSTLIYKSNCQLNDNLFILVKYLCFVLVEFICSHRFVFNAEYYCSKLSYHLHTHFIFKYLQ